MCVFQRRRRIPTHFSRPNRVTGTDRFRRVLGSFSRGSLGSMQTISEYAPPPTCNVCHLAIEGRQAGEDRHTHHRIAVLGADGAPA